jgi:hypothetical protein
MRPVHPSPAWLLGVLSVLALVGAAAAEPDLYVGRTLVTGQGPEGRMRGFAECLEEVLVKVSGDPRLADDPRVDALAARAEGLVAEFSYRDRMAGIPVHDEQGTRDRPYDLTVRFQPDAIDTALRALGRSPWISPRPRVGVIAQVRNGSVAYILAGDGDRGRDMREALMAAAWEFGIPVRLPSSSDLVEAQPSAATPGAANNLEISDVALSGSVVWDERALGWVAEWRLDSAGETRRWGIHGVSFDAAFRSAVGGAAQILSGNGTP